jgi:hypothetical protein
MVATSRSTTTTISIATIISTATSLATDKVIGSTIPKTEATRPTGIGKLRINTGVKALVALAALEIAKAELELGIVPELELGIVPELELGIVPAVAALGIAQVEVELAIVQAVAEQGTVQVEVELALVQPEVALEPVIDLAEGLEIGHPLAHPAGLLRTRSGIGAHRRGLVPVLGAEDLAGAVVTTLEPAAVGAVKAWAAVA